MLTSGTVWTGGAVDDDAKKGHCKSDSAAIRDISRCPVNKNPTGEGNHTHRKKEGEKGGERLAVGSRIKVLTQDQHRGARRKKRRERALTNINKRPGEERT